MLHFDWCYALHVTTRKGLGKLCSEPHLSRYPAFGKVGEMGWGVQHKGQEICQFG